MEKNYFKILDKAKSKFKDTKIITYDDMLKVPTGVELIYNEDKNNPIKGTRIHQDDGNISFRMIMPKDSVFQIHKHDCIETCVVYKGLLIDNISGTKIQRLQSISFDPNVPHIIRALEDSIFYVEFIKK